MKTPGNKINRILALAITVIGFEMAASAQTLLYEWNFTNTASTTLTSSVPTYAYVPDTGNLYMRNSAGTGAGVNAYFTNGPGIGPGSGPGGSAQGALVLTGQGYGGTAPVVVTLATNLNIGKRLQFTVTFWFHFGTAVGTAGGTGSFPRILLMGAGTGFDSGSANTGVGVGASVNNWTAANGPGDGVYFAGAVQNGNGNTSANISPLGTHFTIPGETGVNTNGIVASDASTNWYFEAMTFDGSLSSAQLKTWLGTGSTNVVLVGTQDGSANMVPLPDFTTNAVLMLANRNSGSRPIVSGGVADVRIYCGVVSSNNLEAIRTFSTNFVDSGSCSVSGPPTIQLPPASGSTHTGLSRTFNVIATGYAPLSYQWKTNNVSVVNETNTTFTLKNVPFSLNGAQISCTVTNILGSTNSAAATLTVVDPPAGSYAAAVVSNNPYIYWHLNETTNGSANPANPVTIFDYASGLDGLAVDPVNTTFNLTGLDAPVYPGFATTNIAIMARGNGNFSRLNMPSLPRYTNDMTICGWIFITNSPPNSFAIIYSMNGGNNGTQVGFGYGLFFNNNAGTDIRGRATRELSYNWNLTGLNTANFSSGLNVPVNEWTFIALTIDPKGTNATLYMGSHSGGLQMSVDDTNVTADVISGTAAATAPILLGRSPYSYYEQGQGSANGGNNMAFNDVAIFYTALSPDAINNLYLAGAGVPVVDKWVGNVSSDWDTTTANWTSGGVATNYSDGSAVLFNDSANTGNVNIPGTVTPYSITVSNNTLAYEIGGNIAGPANLIKEGNNVLTLSGASTYSSLTTVAKGMLLVTGSINSGANITGGTLGGNFGTISGTVTARSGGTLAPGATLSTAGTFLTVGGLTLLPGSTTVMKVAHSGSTLSGDQIYSGGTITYGGTLIIATNAGDATPYHVGNTVTLFVPTGSTGISNSFASIQPAPGPGLAWSNDAVNLGQFDVIVAPPPVAGFSGVPTNIFVTQTVVFTNTSTGIFTSSAWSFGDGNVANTSGAGASSNVSNTYNTTGNYTVTLVVTGSGGSSTNTQTAYIVVKPKLAIGQLVLSSGNLTLSGTNGPIGQQYRILTTTNVALNVASWTPVFTNVFTPPNGSYSYTNAALTNKASFYRLVSP